MATLYTVGHGARSIDDLLEVVSGSDVGLVVDVRRFPASRRHPHFAREPIEASLAGAGIDYDWRGDTLGGRRAPVDGSRHPGWRNSAFQGYADHMDTDEFRRAFEEVLDRARETPTAVMCAETLWWRCHRRLIADAALLHGWAVEHLIDRSSRQSHVLHEAARRDEQGFPVYDIGSQQQLL